MPLMRREEGGLNMYNHSKVNALVWHGHFAWRTGTEHTCIGFTYHFVEGRGWLNQRCGGPSVKQIIVMKGFEQADMYIVLTEIVQVLDIARLKQFARTFGGEIDDRRLSDSLDTHDDDARDHSRR